MWHVSFQSAVTGLLLCCEGCEMRGCWIGEPWENHASCYGLGCLRADILTRDLPNAKPEPGAKRCCCLSVGSGHNSAVRRVFQLFAEDLVTAGSTGRFQRPNRTGTDRPVAAVPVRALGSSTVASWHDCSEVQWSLYVPHSGHYMYRQFNIQQL